MIAYFDASALAKRYIAEDGSEQVGSWLQAPIIATSRWTHVEVLSAISRRCREGSMTLEQRNRVATALNEDLVSFTVVDLTANIIAIADSLLARHALRAGDSVQLASALFLKQRTGETVRFHAFDVHLNVAATHEGLDVPPPPPSPTAPGSAPATDPAPPPAPPPRS